MSDLSLRKSVMEELEFHPQINAASIGVSVENGIVTLSGHVSSYPQKVNAERAAKGVKGVRAIAQEIQVRLDKHAGTADDTLAERVLNIIDWSADVPQNDIKVTVQKGWITLDGDVDWQYQKETLERAVHELSGVVGVNNRLALRPNAEVTDIRQRIEEALKRNAEIDDKNVFVRVDGDVVRLEGKVHVWRERKLAERAAWSVPGVMRVEDHLLIA
ncbi:BON domain-containing protein [Pseudomonas fluorescens]|uniref:BON domain-containing protein n=1 Tax=Pseudomonas fluorescens TaxID=294 RepID=UPI0016552A77|nr:BON domain-containing protein [Pseudomonas fluorescens]MBC8784268.1 BON domain-containing protein [Pseudomonas fluorescens]WLH76490.1 BON domain-containing protein [Pseudomonas fluorescens]